MERERRVSWNLSLPVRPRCRDPRPRPRPQPDPGFFWGAHIEDRETLFSYFPEDELPFKSEETPKLGSASIGDKSRKSAIKEQNSRVESSLSFEERDQRAMFVQQMVLSIIFNE